LPPREIEADHRDGSMEREEYSNSTIVGNKNGRIKDLVRQLLIELGDDPQREGLRRTPKRVDRALRYLTSGYQQKIDEILNNALFKEKYNEMVIVKDIDFYSLCEHHLLPFYGKCHVAYIPNGKVVGLSKIPRLVDMFARRLQLQERMTTQIAKAIMKALQPAGVAVVSEARHLCMMMRGVQKQNTVVTNSALLGIFHDDRACREEFMQLIGHRQMG
jgi:GTP cyclohydrolase I